MGMPGMEAQDTHPITANISLRLTKQDCMDTIPHANSSHITCYSASIHQSNLLAIGSIKCQLLRKAIMDAIGPNTMWEECQAYDNFHSPGSKVDKVENFLSNECFPPDKQALIDEAKYILFIEEVYVDPEFRGHGISLVGIELSIRELEVGEKCVILLQAAPLVQKLVAEMQTGECAVMAHEKIARHWKRTGFEEWSWTDDAWLCLSTCSDRRPKIEDLLQDVPAKTALSITCT